VRLVKRDAFRLRRRIRYLLRDVIRICTNLIWIVQRGDPLPDLALLSNAGHRLCELESERAEYFNEWIDLRPAMDASDILGVDDTGIACDLTLHVRDCICTIVGCH